MDWMGTPQFRALMRIEEPYEYRDRLTLPKFLLNASGDQFFLPDSSRFYFDDLRGETNLRYVPNASHSLDKTDALESVQAFYASIVAGTPRPAIKWTFERDGSIKVVAKERPDNVLLWQATNPAARNFRQDAIGNAYTSTSLTPQRTEHLGRPRAATAEGLDGVLRRDDVPERRQIPLQGHERRAGRARHAPVSGASAQEPGCGEPGAVAQSEQTPSQAFDVVVYGGTAGGVITAVAAAREGLEVALLEPGRHLGGMVSGGLGWTDYGRKEVIGGYSLEFFERVGTKYGRPIEWHFEPHVAEAVFDELVKEAGVRVFLGHRLREKNGVRESRARA